jgi:broad specificity phosphatase PhoE
MYIYLVRHGETEQSTEEIFRGKKDISLNKTGKKQAEKIGSYFADKDIIQILTSPLLRARQTAKEIGKVTHIQAQEVEGFSDMDLGVWEGLPLREVKRRYPEDFEIWRKSPHKLLLKAGESLADVRRRVVNVLKRTLSNESSNIVLVTHRVICKIIVLHLLQVSNSHFWDMIFDAGSITLLEKSDSKITLRFMNETCHLKERAAQRP